MAKGKQPQGKGAGQPRKPIEQHIADGTYRANVHAAWKKPLAPLSTDLEKPELVKGEASAIWDQVIADLPPNTLHRLDRFNLERYCLTAAKWRDVQANLMICDPLDKSHYNLVQTSIMLNKMLENLGDVLGLTKVSRDKIIKEVDKAKENPFEALRLAIGTG